MCLGERGQAAALDLALFVSICVLSLSFLFIQSAKSSSSNMRIEENENINEVAVRAIEALAHSSGGELEIKTVQPIALAPVEAGFAEDIRTVLHYADKCADLLDQLEKAVRNGGAPCPESPHLTYFQGKLGHVSSYLLSAKDLVGGAVREWLEEAEAEMGAPCEAIGHLAELLPGYEGMEGGCLSGIGSQFLEDLMSALLDAEETVSDFEGTIARRLESLTGMAGEELAEGVRALRCALTEVKDLSNSLLTYLETGLNMEVSFLELWPVEARVDGMTLERMLGDSMVVGGNFAMGDDLRAVAGAAGLLLLRDGQAEGENLTVEGSMEELEGAKNSTEYVLMRAKDPLRQVTNASSEGPYHELMFGSETYLTPSRALAVRLRFWGGGIPVKQKTEYFEDIDYVLNTSAYPTQPHKRAYNTSSIQGTVTEAVVTVTERNWTEAENLSDEMTGVTEFREIRILRPMAARANLTYGNRTWGEEAYSFDIEHCRLSSESDYLVNTSQKESDGNLSEAFKSIILGIIFSERAGLKTRVEEAVEARLEELLQGYEYKFLVKDGCRTFLEINADLEPEGRAGMVKQYFVGDGTRAEMRLTVWR